MKRSSYNVRIWSIQTNNGKKKTSYTLRWSVDGHRSQDTFSTKKLAESFRATLLKAARDGEPFDVDTGIPVSRAREASQRTWYEHACAFVDMKWPHASPRHRKSIAESLATVTPALTATTRGMPGRKALRRALFTWSFNTSARAIEPSRNVESAARWAASNTVDLAELADPKAIRRALDALAVTLKGKSAAATTVARKRAVFFGAVQYAVELGYFDANPISRVQWRAPKMTDSVDRRVVVNPTQARALLAAVREIAPSLEAFYACLYFAALRPAEALHLRRAACSLPDETDDNQWGELLLTGSTQQVGAAWGDTGHVKQDQALKHRAVKDTRSVPACPELVTALRHHLTTFGTGADDRLFVTRTGRFGRPMDGPYATPVSTNTTSRVWRKARRMALSATQAASPLAARPYDLRHAAVSLWLNAGVPATQVAEWAGHSVAVLLRVYAKCIHGQQDAARLRIAETLQQHGDAG